MGLPPHLQSQHFRARAEECRTMADAFHNERVKAKMIKVAEDYERMALTAERIEQQEH
jgi:hypothetical protein